MSPKVLMLLGGLGGFGLLIAFSFTPAGGSTVAVFALGALFGKGYGIWEERARRAKSEVEG